MSVEYRIYSNDGLGGPIDYSTPIATVSALTYDTDPLDPGGVYAFAVRAYDTVSAIEEQNADAVVTITLDGAGADATGVPGAPFGLDLTPEAGGGLFVGWSYLPAAGQPAPTGFKVWRTAGGTVNYAAAPAATVPYVAGTLHYSTTLAGLAEGATYAVGVRATNAAGTEANTTVAGTVRGAASGPGPVTGLAAAVTDSER